MSYDRTELQKIARKALLAAHENLQTYGRILPIGMVFDEDGLTRLFPFNCEDLQVKRILQEEFKNLLVKVGAKAAVVVTESWLKEETQMPPNLTRSIADDPARKEAIVIEAASSQARYMIIQIFRKDPSGRVRFDPPIEPYFACEVRSEWLDGVWPDRKPN